MSNLSTKDWLFPHSQVNEFVFNPSPRDFIVEEIPLYSFSGSGEHTIIKVRKKGLTTWELIDKLSSNLNIPKKFIGYAGLKDKNALTTQYISIPKDKEGALESLKIDGVKFLELTRHTNKIRVGHLKGNRFHLRFKKVLGSQKDKIESILKWIDNYGMPNYFGLQRFGVDKNNYKEGKEIVSSKLNIRDRKLREFLIGSYQSKLFNDWLGYRVKLSRLLEEFKESEIEALENLESGALKGTKAQKHFFKIILNDLMMHYPFGKLFFAQDLESEAKKFLAKDRAPTGLIAGKRVKRALNPSRDIEARFDDERIKESGSRRYAWVFPSEIRGSYTPQKAHYELSFILPKGSYATVLVAMLKGGWD